MKPKRCGFCGTVFTPGGGRQMMCDPCRGVFRLQRAEAAAEQRKGAAPASSRQCSCGADFAPKGRQRRCDACLAAAAQMLPRFRGRGRPRINVPPGTALSAAGPQGAPPAGPRPRETNWAAPVPPPLPVPEAEALGRLRADLEAMRKAAEALLRRYAQDASPHSRGVQSAALTLLNAAGFARHPTERRYASREELAGLGHLEELEALQRMAAE